MNTLNYKALLIKTVFIVFIRAVAIYLLITLPVLVTLPEMYELSAIYALSFGWIAAMLFLLFFYLLKKTKMKPLLKLILLHFSVAICVLVAFQLMEVTGVERHIWNSGAFLLFPAVAVIAGCFSIAASRNSVQQQFETPQVNYYSDRIQFSKSNG